MFKDLFDSVGECVDDTVDFVVENPGKCAVVAASSLVVGVSAAVAAPIIAATAGSLGLLGTASTGVAISSLKGASLASASLAAFSGGALVTGGSGMLGGTAVISLAGASIGGLTAAASTGTKNSDTTQAALAFLGGGALIL